jgi:hypothetical protein
MKTPYHLTLIAYNSIIICDYESFNQGQSLLRGCCSLGCWVFSTMVPFLIFPALPPLS